MEWEIYEPDPNDEFYDEMCTAAYADACGRIYVQESYYGSNAVVDTRFLHC